MEDKQIQTDPSLTSESLLLLNLQHSMSHLTNFVYGSAQEHRKNYAAINAQLHLINERLRSSDSVAYGGPSSVATNMKMQKELLRCISKDKVTVGKDNIEGNETIHRECLMEKLRDMVKDMDLGNTNLMDELLNNECLTQDEASEITHTSSRKDQIRKLIVLFAKRGRGNFVKFLEVIGRKHQYPEIARELKEIYTKKTSEGRSSECLLCVIKRDVDIRDVVDHLCHRKIIDVEFLDLLVSGKSGTQNSLWEIVFSNIDKSANRKEHIHYLQEALSIKYDCLASKLGFQTPPQLGNHICSKAQHFSASWRSTGSVESSIGDLSTTSEVPRKSDSEELRGLDFDTNANIPKCVVWLSSIEPSQSDEFSSTSDNQPTPDSSESRDSGLGPSESERRVQFSDENETVARSKAFSFPEHVIEESHFGSSGGGEHSLVNSSTSNNPS